MRFLQYCKYNLVQQGSTIFFYIIFICKNIPYIEWNLKKEVFIIINTYVLCMCGVLLCCILLSTFEINCMTSVKSLTGFISQWILIIYFSIQSQHTHAHSSRKWLLYYRQIYVSTQWIYLYTYNISTKTKY